MKELGKTIDDTYSENTIIECILAFYDTYCKSDRLRLYSYFSTAFQKEVPLNYFLIHPDFNIDLGKLIEIKNIRVEKNNLIAVEITVEINNKDRDVVVTLIKDFGGWKIEGESIFRGNFS